MKDLNKFYFPGREAGETITMVLRRHPIVIYKRLIALVFALFVPIAIGLAVHHYVAWLYDRTSLYYGIAMLLASLYYLIIILVMYHAWVNYYLDLLVVTNERVVTINQKGVFDRQVSELQLDRIQDVSSEVKGFTASFFKYGTIELQSAGRDRHFIFTQIPNAEMVASQISEMHEQYVAARQKANQPQPLPPDQATGGL